MRLRHKDSLSQIVRAATVGSVGLTTAEFDAVRHLLEDEGTWNEIGGGTVEDLAILIAACLPPHDGRSVDDSLVISRTIARGLLEFAVAELDPEKFQQVLLARLERMEADRATALDEAILGLHADLAAQYAQQEEADANRFNRVMAQLRRVLDLVPPGPADHGDVAVYLATLIRWLNVDTWPQDTRLGGPVLTPAAIERKLKVRNKGPQSEQDLDADELARRCERLVVLGDPGSGKTWLARRTARRCAEAALAALVSGRSGDEIELPLYTTCSQLFAARGDIRQAVVSSALEQLPDLGGSRISAALRLFFGERNAQTLLVIDSLDEAHGPDDRLRQADTLPRPWRIVLTSRQSSWNQQLAISEEDHSRRVVTLQPLRYPDDVEPFIVRWFAQKPGRGENLTAQIARRPSLQHLAKVPLILTYCCIIGGDQPLPDLRRDLYAMVLKRMLTGRWRDSCDRDPDVAACLDTLRAWAWSAATSDPVSGVGMWADIFPAPRARIDRASMEALDHAASPISPPDIDSGTTRRRFVHRSFHEHLVAEHVASLTAADAARELLSHIWYDPDWEYAAPAALAMHPQRDEVLRMLVCRAMNSDEIPDDVSSIDGCGEFRRFLSRTALESKETCWSPQMGKIIGRARAAMATLDRYWRLEMTAHWPISNDNAREELLRLFDRERDDMEAARLARMVACLCPTAEDRRQVRETLLWRLRDTDDVYEAEALADSVAVLAMSAGDAADRRQGLDDLLGATTRAHTLERDDAVTMLAASAEDKHYARTNILKRLGPPTYFHVAEAAWLIARLDPTAEEQRYARGILLDLLSRQSGWAARALAGVLIVLDPTAEDRTAARQKLLSLLDTEAGDRILTERLTDLVAALDPTAEDMRQARKHWLRLLATETMSHKAIEIAKTVSKLDPSTENRDEIRHKLLGLLATTTSATSAADLARAVSHMDLTARERRQVSDKLLSMLSPPTRSPFELLPPELLARLDPPAEDLRQAREQVLGQLDAEPGPRVATGLARTLARLGPTGQEQRRAREQLLALLTQETDSSVAIELARALTTFDPTEQEQRRAREQLLTLLAQETDSTTATGLARVLANLNPTADDMLPMRQKLLELLSKETRYSEARWLAEIVGRLSPTARELAGERNFSIPPESALLNTVRRNSEISEWLTALPSLRNRPQSGWS
jgi:hypothetical protein